MLPAGNFLLVPAPGLQEAKLYTLSDAASHYRNSSFVVIPYSEPRLKKPVPQFYSVLSTEKITDLPGQGEVPPSLITAQNTREKYISTVKQLKQQIQAGNIYEINYCALFSAQIKIDPLSVFLNLCRHSNAPFQFLARLGNDYILCGSPELFLKKKGNILSTKPIKGTIGRGKDEEEDQFLKKTLQNSLKDRTENVMAVDVARNDLSRLATRASVRVNQLYNIESYKTVHQMVSTVSCELKPAITFAEIIEATFPMASMTGAPKHRAMQLIGEHETFDRGYYSGTMGLIDERGDFELPVVIRSIFYNAEQKKVWFATGGAITYLSEPEKEYEECLLKTRSMLAALNAELR